MNAYIEDAKGLMEVADCCDTSTEQAVRLYTQAANILNAIPSDTLTIRERITAQHLVDDATTHIVATY